MKNVFILIVLSIISLTSFAQTNNLTVFSEKGEEFILYVNSIKQNETPAANVTAKDIKGESFMARLVFVDKSIPEITQNFWTESKNVEISAVVKLNNKGKYVLRSMGETAKSNDSNVAVSGSNATYESPSENSGTGNASGTVVTTTPVTNQRNPNINENISMDINVSETGMNVTTGAGADNLTMNITADENGMNMATGVGGEIVSMNISVSENGMNMNTGVGGQNLNMNINVSGNDNLVVDSYEETVTTNTTATTGGTTIIPSDDYSSNSSGTVSRCSYAMSAAEFDEAISSIKAKSFEDTKLTTAKQICKSSCMTADQIRDFNKAFSFEDSRLEFAKYAYDYVYDSSKYYKVNDSFQFEMTAEELDEYLQSK